MNALRKTLLALTVAIVPFGATPSFGQTQSDATARPDGGIYLQGLGGRGTSSTVGDPALSTVTSGAALGWQPMESLRLELEYLYRNSGPDRVGNIADSAPSVGDSRSLMANALIDFNFAEWATPYVGVGVGWTRVEPPTQGFAGFARDDVFAYQGIVGLSVPFSDTLSFFADGRFMRSDDFSLGVASTADGHLQSWSALAGFRFTFGGAR